MTQPIPRDMSRLSPAQLKAAQQVCPKLLKQRNEATSLVQQVVIDRRIQEVVCSKLGIAKSGPERKFNNTIVHRGLNGDFLVSPEAKYPLGAAQQIGGNPNAEQSANAANSQAAQQSAPRYIPVDAPSNHSRSSQAAQQSAPRYIPVDAPSNFVSQQPSRFRYVPI